MKNKLMMFGIQVGNKVKALNEKVKSRIALSSKATGKITLAVDSGEGYVDSGVKILIAVVVGSLLLAGIILLMNGTILPDVTQSIQDMFGKVTP